VILLLYLTMIREFRCRWFIALRRSFLLSCWFMLWRFLPFSLAPLFWKNLIRFFFSFIFFSAFVSFPSLISLPSCWLLWLWWCRFLPLRKRHLIHDVGYYSSNPIQLRDLSILWFDGCRVGNFRPFFFWLALSVGSEFYYSCSFWFYLEVNNWSSVLNECRQHFSSQTLNRPLKSSLLRYFSSCWITLQNKTQKRYLRIKRYKTKWETWTMNCG